MPAREVGGEIGQGDFGETPEQQRLGLGERAFERGVHRLLDQALRRLVAVADGEHRRLAQGLVQLAEGDGAQVGLDAPSTRVASLGLDDAGVPQETHGAPDDDGIGSEALRQGVGGHGPFLLGHVQQGVKDRREAAVAFHATYDVAY